MGRLPEPESVVGVLLVGGVALFGLRVSAPVAWGMGALAAVLFGIDAVAAAIARDEVVADLGGPAVAAVRDPGTSLPVLLGATLVLGSAPMAAWAASGLSRGAGGSPHPRVEPEEDPLAESAPTLPAPLGTSPAETDTARPIAAVRDVSLALLGVDPAGEGDAVRAMRLLDEVVAASLAASDAISEYGPMERLVVLPGVSASVLSAGATQLCLAAAKRVGRPVRAAVATAPGDGSTLRHLLRGLEAGLASCRGADATVLWVPDDSRAALGAEPRPPLTSGTDRR
jgi:hypothetical protein